MSLSNSSSPRLFCGRKLSVSSLTVLMVGILCCSNTRTAVGHDMLPLSSSTDLITLFIHELHESIYFGGGSPKFGAMVWWTFHSFWWVMLLASLESWTFSFGSSIVWLIVISVSSISLLWSLSLILDSIVSPVASTRR